MNTHKIFAFFVKTGEVISSVRRINKATSIVRVISYVILAVMLIVNIGGMLSSVKDNI